MALPRGALAAWSAVAPPRRACAMRDNVSCAPERLRELAECFLARDMMGLCRIKSDHKPLLRLASTKLVGASPRSFQFSSA